MKLTIPIRPTRIALVLGIIAIYLAAQSIVGRYIEESLGGDTTNLIANLVRVFNINRESSIPTWYSSSLLLMCAVVLGIIAAARRAEGASYIRHWAGLAIIFLYLSIDEGAAIHESFTEPLQVALDVTNHLYFAWVLVAAPLVILFGLVYLKFLFHLPARIRYIFMLAGIVYVSGALVIESISANQWYLDDGSSLFYSAIGTLEELCEMLGVILLIYGALSYIEQLGVAVSLQPQTVSQPVRIGSPARLNALLIGLLTGNNTASQGIQSSHSPDVRRTSQLSLRGILSSPAVIVFFGGMNLILIQWVLVREMTALLLGTELVMLLVSIAYFVGLSVGYRLAGRVNRRWLVPLGALTLVAHLTLPVWFRLLAAGLDSIGAYGAVFLLLPILTPFIVSAFYSIFLPLFADAGEGRLSTLYGLELVGAGVGVLLVILGGIGLPLVYFLYAAGLLVILLALKMHIRWVGLLAAFSIGWLLVLPNVNHWSNSLWYEAIQGLPPGTTTLFTGYSPYQKVDVLEAPDGRRYLYLDGLNHFGTTDGERLNVVSGQIPASLVQPENALVFGAGSMQMAAMIADHSGQVLTVELDSLVVDVSRRFFLPYNRLDVLTNRRIQIDDAKHFIANTDQIYDFVATDLPAAYSIQTAALYSEAFFTEVARHMNPGGLFVVNLTSEFQPDDLVSRRILAGLLPNFDDVMVVTPYSVGWSFAYASDNLPFDTVTMEAALRASGEESFVIYETAAVRASVGDAASISLDTMDIVLQVSADWIADRVR